MSLPCDPEGLRRLAASSGAVLGGSPRPAPGEPAWCLAELSGRLVELAGWRAGAGYTFALALALDAQRNQEPVAWVTPGWRSFLPSDAEECGLDLGALPVVRVAGAREIAVAADVLARSGAFGLIVLDLGPASLSLGVLARLAGLARAHESAIVALTEKAPERPSLGSFVSLRADARFERRRDGSYACELTVARDRLRATTWSRTEARHGPPGLS